MALQLNIAKAKAKGYTDAQIQAFLAKQQGGTQQMQQPTAPVQQASDPISSFLMSLVKPFTNTAQSVGEAGYQLFNPQSAYNRASRNDADLSDKPTDTMFMSREELEKRGNSIVPSLRDAAGVASFAVPIAPKGTGAVTSILPQAGRAGFGVMKGGAVAGALSTAGQEDSNLTDIVKGGLFGAGTAGILNKILGGMSGRGGKAKDVGKTMQKEALNIQSKNNASKYLEEEATAAIYNKPEYQAVFSGANKPKDILKSIGVIKQNANNALNNLAGQEGKMVPYKDVAKKFIDDLAYGTDVTNKFNVADPAHMSELASKLSKLKRTADKNGGMISFKDLYNWNLQFKDSVSKASKRGTPVASEITDLEMSKVLRNLTGDEAIWGDTASKYNQYMKVLSDMEKIAPGIGKATASKDANLRLFGANISNLSNLKQGAKMGFGKKIERLGNKMESVNPLAGLNAAATGARAVNPLLDAMGREQNQSMPSPLDTSMPTSMDTTTDTSTSGLPKISTEDLLMARLQLSPKEYDVIREVYDIQQKEGATGNKTEAQQTRDTTSQLIKDAYTQFVSNPNLKVGMMQGPTQQFLSKFNAADPDTLSFITTINNLKAFIAKARGGTSFTPNEEALLNSYTPTEGDSSQQLQTKLTLLYKNFVKE